MVGHMWPLMRNPFDFFADLRASGNVIKIYIGKRPIYFLTNARLAHQVGNSHLTRLHPISTSATTGCDS